VGDEVFAGAAQLPQGEGGIGVTQQRGQPAPVGAHRVGQHVGVEPVVLVARRAITPPQGFDLRRGYDVDGDASGPQRVDDRPVRALNAHSLDLAAGEQSHHAGDTRLRMRDGDPLYRLAVAVHHAHGVVGLRPVDARGQRWCLGGDVGQTHNCFSTAQPEGEAPGGCGTPLPVAH
jgi:hypothetical protein